MAIIISSSELLTVPYSEIIAQISQMMDQAGIIKK
jgi:hypothetical protein